MIYEVVEIMTIQLTILNWKCFYIWQLLVSEVWLFWRSGTKIDVYGLKTDVPVTFPPIRLL